MAGRYGSVVTAMVTPFKQDFSLDVDRAQEIAAWLFDHGTDSLVVSGSTGEASTLSDQEKFALFRATVEVAKEKGSVIAGTGTYDTAHSIHLSKEAEKAGADAILVVTPYYNKPPQSGLIAHFTAIADSVDLPVLLYNIPGRTALRIEHETILELSRVENIIGVKDSTGDIDGVSRLIAEVPDNFDVYCGDDWATFAYACLGSAGVVSVASHLAGERIAQIRDLVATGDTPAARKIHEELLPLFRGLFITSSPIPVKAALAMIGQPVGPPRLPLVPATVEEEAVIKKALEDAGVL